MRRKFSVEDRLWFTSDTHYGHVGIVYHAARRKYLVAETYVDVVAMDKDMVDAWNAVVQDGDHVFHLGDFSFHRPDRTLDILSRLKGVKYLIRGNHDRNNLNGACLAMFDGGVEHYHEITVGSQLICLCHFPFRSWNGMHHDSWNLHGHSHGTLVPQGKQLDVGVDVHGLPISYMEVEKIMKERKFVKQDHHGRVAEVPDGTKPESVPE